MAGRTFVGWGLAVLGLSCLPAPAVEAQTPCGSTSVGAYWWVASGRATKADPDSCSTLGFRCYPVENQTWFLEKTNPACNPLAGSCTVKLHATATIPELANMVDEPASRVPPADYP